MMTAWTHLRDQIDDVFNGEEFASLCFDLGLSADQWTVETKTRKIELFLLTLYEKGRLNDLGAVLHRSRPSTWPSATLDLESSAPPFEAAPVSQLTINSAGGLVNTGTMTVGGDMVGGNQDKRTIIHVHRVPKWLPIPILLFFVVVFVIGWLIKPMREAAMRQVHDWGWNWTQPEGPDETLILIATFTRGEGMQEAKPQDEIKAGILAAAKEMSNNDPKINLRVVIVPSQLEGDEQAPAAALGKRYNASLMIWGNETAVRTTVNFLNLKQPKASASNVKISETERSQMADPKAYVQLVTRDLPNQMRFLALFAVGQAYYQKGKVGYESSFKAIDSAVRTQLPVSQTVTGLADAYFRLGWLNHELKRELTQTIKLYDRVIDLDANYAWAYNNRGGIYAFLKQYKRAIQDYDKAIDLDKNLAGVYYNRGSAYVGLMQYEHAIQDYDKAINLDKNITWAYYGRGVTYYDLKQYERAIRDFDKTIAIDKNFAWAYYNRGLAYHILEQYALAIQDYNKAIDLDKNDVEVYSKRGNTYFRLKQYALAIQDYDKAIDLDRNFAVAYKNRGLAYARLNQYERAIQDFDKAIDLDRNDSAAYNNRGIAYYGLKQYEYAIQDFSKAIDFDKNSAKSYPDVYSNRGNAYAMLKYYAQAIQDFNKAIDLDKNDTVTYINRGNVYNALKQYERAIQDFDKAIDLDKNYAAAYNNRGNAYYDLKQYERAIQDYKKYLELDPTTDYKSEVEKIIKDLEAQKP